VVGEKRKHPDGEPTTELDNAEGSLLVVDDAEEEWNLNAPKLRTRE
jgi:hypothetical protein